MFLKEEVFEGPLNAIYKSSWKQIVTEKGSLMTWNQLEKGKNVVQINSQWRLNEWWTDERSGQYGPVSASHVTPRRRIPLFSYPFDWEHRNSFRTLLIHFFFIFFAQSRINILLTSWIQWTFNQTNYCQRLSLNFNLINKFHNTFQLLNSLLQVKKFKLQFSLTQILINKITNCN